MSIGKHSGVVKYQGVVNLAAIVCFSFCTSAFPAPAKTEIACDIPVTSKASKKAHDQGCLIALSELDKLRTEKDFTLVDVRAPAEYDDFRIAGSINIPLHSVKTKVFLKKIPVVLVNEGRSTAELEQVCGELKQTGFERVAVLDGGLLAWSVSKRSLDGDIAAQSKLNLMSAEELFAEHERRDWFVLDLSQLGKYKDMRSWLPSNMVPISIKSKGDLIARISSAIAKQRKTNPKTKFLLIAENNDVYEQFDVRLKKSGIALDLLRLDGGLNEYREHVAKQLALWKQQNQPRRYDACRG